MVFKEVKSDDKWSLQKKYRGRKKNHVAEILHNQGSYYFLIEKPNGERFNSLWNVENYGSYNTFDEAKEKAESWIDIELKKG